MGRERWPGSRWTAPRPSFDKLRMSGTGWTRCVPA
jgi:hypothetical protein